MVQTKDGDGADNIVGVAMMIELNEIMKPVGDDNPLPVSGSFSITGGATSANQDTQITAANATNTKLDTVITHVDGIETLLGSQATAAKQDTLISQTDGIEGSVASIDTKMDAQATAAKQDTQITHLSAIETAVESIDTKMTTLLSQTDGVESSLSSIDGKTPALGQAAMAASTPVVIASNQSALPVTTVIPGVAATNLGKAEDAAHASGDTGVMALAVANVAQSTFGADADYTPISVDLKGNTMEVGNIAHDGVDAGNPIKTGGRARTSEIAAVANDDRTDSIHDKVGRQVIAPYALPENFVSGAITSAMTGTASTSLVAAPAGSLRNYITTIVVSNAHATVGTDVVIQDGNGGTTLMTIPAAAVYGGAVINLPVPLRQPTTGTAIYVANVTTGASTKVSAVGFTGL